MKWSSWLSENPDGSSWPEVPRLSAVQILVLDSSDLEILQSAEIVYRDLKAHGFDALLDDRAVQANVKFDSADRMGLPIRIVMSSTLLQAGEIELIETVTRRKQKVALENAVEKTVEKLRELKRV